MSAVERSDAIQVVGDWISEHYFTTDSAKESFKSRVLARRATWEEQKEHGTPRTRLSASRQALLRQMVALAGLEDPAARREASAELNAELAEILGFGGPGQRVDTHGPVRTCASPGLEEPVIAVLSATAPLAEDGAEPLDALLAKDADALTEPFLDEETGDELRSVARLLSALFVSGAPRPAFALVLAGRWIVVAERERWPEGRYLAIDLQLVLERSDDRRGGELDRALACISADALVPDAEGAIWWTTTLEESARHTVGVSKDLREGIRESIEIIANEVVQRRAAKGLDPLPKEEAQPLAKQALRFLYRILFLLYAEASPELGVLPVREPEYERGYGLDRLRDLTLVELATPQAREGTHLFESLATLFRLVDQGHDPGEAERVTDGLRFQSLRADLFLPSATAHIDAVGLGNAAMQQVLEHLLLSKARAKKDRGFISYAELGINQLGAVYEGLMSYTGFFAEEDLYEVAKGGDAEKGSWVVPVSRFDEELREHLVTETADHTGEVRPVVHPKGSFVYRLSGRDRQQSASYYTPEVLTRFVVSQALQELLDQDGHTTSAAEILELTICEPALGSGAFAIEAVRQLAEEYLRRRQDELGERIDPDAYPRELQRVKAHLALHQVYGVDLNPTAVELAEISLWLDTMVEGLQAPWFGLRLRAGNSLIGAQRAVYSTAQVTSKRWLKEAPIGVGAGPDERPEIKGAIPHFLLPAEGWGAAADVGKEIKELAPDAVASLKAWRRELRKKPTKQQLDRLVDLGHRVEHLWELAAQRLRIAEAQARRDIAVWGAPSQPAPEGRVVTREEIEQSLADADGAYRRLRRVMDAWCALWFWPLTESEVKPPTLAEWLDALELLLGRYDRKGEARGQLSLGAGASWADLGAAEQRDLEFALVQTVDVVRAQHPWLQVCERVADVQRFFHWDFDFATVFNHRGGFDLQVGNPPWVRPSSDLNAFLAEYDAWWMLARQGTSAELHERRQATVATADVLREFLRSVETAEGNKEFLGAVTNYPLLTGLAPDLYRCFMARSWDSRHPSGVVALIHPDTHFADERTRALRRTAYRMLRRKWKFINELDLFEAGHRKTFAVCVYGASRDVPGFLAAFGLFHPETVERSLVHDGSDLAPGIKDDQDAWDCRPHRARVLTVTESVLAVWHDLLETPGTPILETRQIGVGNVNALSALQRLSAQPRVASLGADYVRGLAEDAGEKRGILSRGWSQPETWNRVCLQGPHASVFSPFYQEPRPTLGGRADWDSTDLEALGPGAVPACAYVSPEGGGYSSQHLYCLVWRTQADPMQYRTLIPTIYPSSVRLLDSLSGLTLGNANLLELVLVNGTLGSLLVDFLVRTLGRSNNHSSTIEQLPVVASSHPLAGELAIRVLGLTCLTTAYAALWESVAPQIEPVSALKDGRSKVPLPSSATLGGDDRWSADSPLRLAIDRRAAQVEIDALVAVAFGVSVDDLCTIYRTQFPVLRSYDLGKGRTPHYYDANGRLVPNSVLTVWRKKGDAITEEERTATNASGNTYVYELPYVTLDREADMRMAYAHFEQVLAEHGDG